MAVSDVLSDAIGDIQLFLSLCPDTYDAEAAGLIQDVLAHMELVRSILDRPPDGADAAQTTDKTTSPEAPK